MTRTHARWSAGAGEMAGRIRAHDWAATPLGPIERWPQSRKTAVDIMLDAGHAAQIALGPEWIVLYNDALAPLLGDRHPGALGAPLREAWPDLWGAVEPLVERVFAGETVRFEAVPPVEARRGCPGSAGWDLSCSPVRGESGAVAGLLTIAVDAAACIRAERAERERDEANARLRFSEERQAFLLRLGDALRPLVDPDAVRIVASGVLGEALGADRVTFGDIDPNGRDSTAWPGYARGEAPSPAATDPAETCAEVFEALWNGRTFVASDVPRSDILSDRTKRACASVGFEALIAVPLPKPDRVLWTLSAASGTPRAWTGRDVGLVRETLERTWDAVERARAEAALRASEARFAQFAASSSDALWIRDAATLAMEYASPAIQTIYGIGPDVILGGIERWVHLIVPDDRATARAHLEQARRGEAVTHEFRIRRPVDGEERWIRNTDFPLRDAGGRVQRIGGIAEDVTELKLAEAALVAAEIRQRTLMEGIPQLVWRSCGEGRWTWSSPQWQAFTGQSQEESRGFGWLDAVHPDDQPATLRAWDEARPHGALDVEYRVRHAADGAWFWHHTRSAPLRDGEGRIVEWLGTSTDVQQLKELQARQGVLVAELQHRTRNLLGVVRSMSDSTLARSSDLSDFRARFADRLAALARAQGLLSRHNEWDRVTFDELIGSELSALDGEAERISLAGPEGVALRSSTVQTLALALHELATNALKYGALAQAQGRLAIAWRLERAERDDRPWLYVEWRESGVAMPAGAAGRGGSGRELIERALPYQLGARTSLVLGGDGVHCTIALPVSERQRPGEEAHA